MSKALILSCRFQGLRLPVPRDIETTIVGCYNEAALDTCKTNYYNHRREQYWTGAKATIECELLEDALNMR